MDTMNSHNRLNRQIFDVFISVSWIENGRYMEEEDEVTLRDLQKMG